MEKFPPPLTRGLLIEEFHSSWGAKGILCRRNDLEDYWKWKTMGRKVGGASWVLALILGVGVHARACTSLWV